MYLTRKKNDSMLSFLLKSESPSSGLLLAGVQALISLLFSIILTTPLLA